MHITGRQHLHKGAPPAVVSTWWNRWPATSPDLWAPNRSPAEAWPPKSLCQCVSCLRLRNCLPGEGWPLPLLPARFVLLREAAVLTLQPRRPSSPAMQEPSVYPSACFCRLIFPIGAFSRVCQFPHPGGPLLRQPPPRQSLQGRVGVLRCSSRTPWGRAVQAVPKLQWQCPSTQIFFFSNPKVLTLKLHVFPGHSYFVCFSISIYGASLPWRSSRSRGNRRWVNRWQNSRRPEIKLCTTIPEAQNE